MPMFIVYVHVLYKYMYKDKIRHGALLLVTWQLSGYKFCSRYSITSTCDQLSINIPEI